MTDQLKQFVTQLRHDAAAQKKKTAALLLLFLVLIVVVGRLFLSGDSPAIVSAEPIAAVPVPPPPPTVVQPSPGVSAVPRPETRRDTARKKGTGRTDPNQDTPRNVIMSGLPRTLARDPFRSTSWFNRSRREKTGVESPQISWLDRLSQHWFDYQTRVDATEHLVDEKVSELVLQSTMIGPVNSAYISGRLVHEGDTVEGFSVARIEARRVTLTFSGVTRYLDVR
jgi:hypothetical protein